MDYFCLRKQVEAGEAHKFSTADLIAHAEAKVKFGSTGIDNLYQKWRSGQTSFDQVRKEYETLRRPETVTFTAIVLRIFRAYADGLSVIRIVRLLNEENVPGRIRSGKGWSPATVSRMLDNEKYIGRWVWNKTKQRRDLAKVHRWRSYVQPVEGTWADCAKREFFRPEWFQYFGRAFRHLLSVQWKRRPASELLTPRMSALHSSLRQVSPGFCSSLHGGH